MPASKTAQAVPPLSFEDASRIEAEIEAEKNTIDGWVNARPVDAKRVAEVIARDRKNAGVE
jgi:hypothetical protein